MSLFQASIAAYPDFAPAYSSMAQLQNSMHFWQPGLSGPRRPKLWHFPMPVKRSGSMPWIQGPSLSWMGQCHGRRHADAANHHAIACELNENDAWTLLSAALGAASRADFIHAHQWQNEAMRLTLSPGPAHWGYLAQIAFLSETYDLCAELGSKAQSLIPHPLPGSLQLWDILVGRRKLNNGFARSCPISRRAGKGAKPQCTFDYKMGSTPISLRRSPGWFAFREGLGKAGLPVAMVSSPYDQKQGLHAAVD